MDLGAADLRRCTTVHAIASVRAVEDAIGATPPPNAELVRNLIAGSQLVHDHVIHFYHLHALDWVDVVSALKANPAKASQRAQSRYPYAAHPGVLVSPACSQRPAVDCERWVPVMTESRRSGWRRSSR